MKNPTVTEIVQAFLQANGYDGLLNEDDDEGCGCGLDDFAPCGGCLCECTPAYLHVDTDGVEHFRCDKPETKPETEPETEPETKE